MIRPKELIAAVLLLTLLGFTYSSPGDNGFIAGESVTHVHMNELDTALDNLEAGTSIAAGITRDTEWDTEGEVQTAWGSVNIILETEFDASSELRALMDDESGTGALLFAAGDIGAATATTASANDNDTSVATTAYVQTEINAAGGTDLTCASGSCDVDAAVTRDSELKAFTIGTSAPVDGTTSCVEGDMYLDHTANKIYWCVDDSTDDWFGVALTDTP